MSQKLSSAVIVTGALRVKTNHLGCKDIKDIWDISNTPFISLCDFYEFKVSVFMLIMSWFSHNA